MKGAGRGILITDGTERAALAVARSLVAAGYEVHVAARKSLSLAGVSRGVQRCILTSDAFENPSGYVEELGRIAEQRGIAVLLPVTDGSVEAVLEHRCRLPPGLVLPLPDLATYRRGSDKLEVLELGRMAGFAVPETVVVGWGEHPGRWSHDMFPAVLKPHRSVVTRQGKRRAVGVTFVHDAAECGRALELLPAAAFPVLLQRRVTGSGEGLFVLRWDGRTVVRFAHRRLREKPPAGGVSVYRESIALDPELVNAGERLLDALDWKGVAMIECKRDRLGRPVLMEVNGRFWGSLQLAVDAGIDFPSILVRCAEGRAAAEATETGYRIGIRSRWLWGDVDHLYLRLTRSLAQLQIADEHDSRLSAVLRFLTFRPGRDHSEVWRWSDPAPFLLETSQRIGLVR